MLEAAASALDNLSACPCVLGVLPHRIGFLFVGVLMGLSLGAFPGLGGLTGLAILFPFTFDMDAYAAISILIGLLAVSQTGDTIPSVLFGIPGTVGSQATIMDGYPMAKKGEAGRAFGAAYTASMIGGVFGALVLAVSIPVLRPIISAFATPEFFMMGIMGISMVSVLSGSAPVKGLIAGTLGLMLGMVGLDPQGGLPRWTFSQLYLWDGLSLVPVTLGVFAIPEVVDLAIRGTRIADVPREAMKGVWTGIRDVFQNWFLMLRSSAIGVWIGFIPGLGAAVVDWFAYGHAAQTERGAQESFGKGDVRGVIAPESANNAKDGGGLIPTLAFGVPGSTVWAIMLGAFLIHGINPGPELLTTRLDVTFTIIWSLAIANVLGTAICLLLTPQLAKITMVRVTLITPVVIAVVFLAAFQSTAHFGDLISLLVFSLMGWLMKRFGWPRPPLILGLVLSGILEANLFVAILAHGSGWAARPLVWLIGILTLASIAYGMAQSRRTRQKSSNRDAVVARRKLAFGPASLFTLVILVFLLSALARAWQWPFHTGIFPWTVAGIGVALCLIQLGSEVWTAAAPAQREQGGLMDLPVDRDVPAALVVRRAATLFGWILGYFAAIWMLGFIISTPLFVWAYLAVYAREKQRAALACALLVAAVLLGVFHYLLKVAWLPAVIGGPEKAIVETIGR